MKKYLSHKTISIISLVLVWLSSGTVKAQNNQFYNDAYQTIDNMLNDKQKYSFKDAVFSVENAYFQGKLIRYNSIMKSGFNKICQSYCSQQRFKLQTV
jgi:hypothetical protein